jgi:homocitrate synthase NifV
LPTQNSSNWRKPSLAAPDGRVSVRVIDTTLRDGEQAPGFAFSKADKVELARLLDRAGVYQIEAGTPAMGSQEKDAILAMRGEVESALIAVWNRLRLDDVRQSLDCRPDVIHISAPVSLALLQSKLGKDAAWLRRELRTCAEFALDRGYRVSVGFEDASRADADFMADLTGMLATLGVSSVRFADTVGILSPSAVYDAVIRFDLSVGIHAHNDLGMAVANSIAACRAGAQYVDATLFGIGERAGNCNLLTFVEAVEPWFDAGLDGEAVSQLEKLAAPIIWRGFDS